MPNATGYVRAKVSIICIDCGSAHDADKRNAPGTTRCPSCARSHGWKTRARKVTYPSCPLALRTCRQCARTYTRNTGGTKYCTKACSHEAQMLKQGCRNRPCKGCGISLGYLATLHLCDACKEARRKERRRVDRKARDGNENHRARARRNGVDYEPINHQEVFERDRWVCGICSTLIDKGLRYPDYMSASLDHIVPLSRGGGHLYSNVQASHWICNSLKGADA